MNFLLAMMTVMPIVMKNKTVMMIRLVNLSLAQFFMLLNKKHLPIFKIHRHKILSENFDLCLDNFIKG